MARCSNHIDVHDRRRTIEAFVYCANIACFHLSGFVPLTLSFCPTCVTEAAEPLPEPRHCREISPRLIALHTATQLVSRFKTRSCPGYAAALNRRHFLQAHVRRTAILELPIEQLAIQLISTQHRNSASRWRHDDKASVCSQCLAMAHDIHPEATVPTFSERSRAISALLRNGQGRQQLG